MVRPHRRPWPAILAATLVAGSVGVWISRSPAAPGAEVATSSLTKPVEVVRLGVNSCNARGCHGAIGTTDPTRDLFYVKGGEANTWNTYDPHSRAYSVLLEPRSVRIGKLLAAELNGEPPHRAKLCLDCHSVTGGQATQPAEVQLAAGVDCEACHGAASAWVGPHVRKEWLGYDRERKESLGFRTTMDLASRAKLCVTCHVGDPSRQVNHDLIAAGHPRLVFELDSFNDALPRHWLEPHEKPDAKGGAGDFHARAWAVGQVAAAESALDLLKSRAAAAVVEKAPWPEFTEHDCFSCHHGLASPSWRQEGAKSRTPGTLPWASLSLPGLKAVADRDPKLPILADGSPLALLKSEMESRRPDPAKVAALADRAAGGVRELASDPARSGFDNAALASLIRAMNGRDRKRAGWDEAAAGWYAINAAARSLRDLNGGVMDPETRAEAERSGKGLPFLPGHDSPKGFQP